MNTASTARTTPTDRTPPIPRARLELQWRLRHTHGRADVLIGDWIVVEPAEEHLAAA